MPKESLQHQINQLKESQERLANTNSKLQANIHTLVEYLNDNRIRIVRGRIIMEPGTNMESYYDDDGQQG